MDHKWEDRTTALGRVMGVGKQQQQKGMGREVEKILLFCKICLQTHNALLDVLFIIYQKPRCSWYFSIMRFRL